MSNQLFKISLYTMKHIFDVSTACLALVHWESRHSNIAFIVWRIFVLVVTLRFVMDDLSSSFATNSRTTGNCVKMSVLLMYTFMINMYWKRESMHICYECIFRLIMYCLCAWILSNCQCKCKWKRKSKWN